MNIRTSLYRHCLTALAVAAFVTPVLAAQPQISTKLEPQSIRQDESAQLSVTVNDASSQNVTPEIPRVDGLNIVPMGQQSTMQIINGTVSASVTHLYQVTAQRTGNFTIPSITLSGATGGKPLSLRVSKGSGGSANSAPQQGGSALPAPAFPQSKDEDLDPQGKNAFLRIILPKKDLTVGELVPVQIKAYFRAGVSASLNGLPVMGNDAFSLNKLTDHPEQSREAIDGATYSVVTWTTALSAVKAGNYNLSLDLPVLLRVKERARSNGAGHNPFKDFFGEDSPFDDDSFFDDFFGRAVEKPMTLHAENIAVKVNAPPTANRPADFSGTVGQFDVKSELSAKSGTTGDPLTLKLIVKGYGNFDRVSFAGLPASADWRGYKPTSHFEPGDSADTSGIKTFEQAIVPLRAGSLTIPALSFSFFDSDTGKYVTKKTKPLTVQVAQGAPTPVAATAAASASSPTPPQAADGLAADQSLPPKGVASLRPLILKPWFITLNAVMLLALLLGTLGQWLWRSRVPQRQKRESEKKAVTDSLAAMDEAVQRSDAPRFFAAARSVLQYKLATQWHLPAGQITVTEISSRLNGSGETLRNIFETADQVVYSGQNFSGRDLPRWREIVSQELQQISQS